MLCERLKRVSESIARAAARAQRSADEIRLLAVTKGRTAPAVREAVEAGVTLLGENRVQEAEAKFAELGAPSAVDAPEAPQSPSELGLADFELHLIGHLQSNKTKKVPGLFNWVQSIDSISTATALSQRCAEREWTCRVLVQFNASGEATKGGYTDEALLLDEALLIGALPALELRGVMTIGAFGVAPTQTARDFARTRSLYERLQGLLPGVAIDTLSMGMSEDYEIAIAEGSTMVRIGTALFGERA